MMINRRLIGSVPESKRYVVASVVCQWTALLANMTMVLAFCRLLDALLTGSAMLADLALTAVVAAGAIAVRAACTVGSAHASYLASSAVKKTLRHRIYQKLLRLGPSYRERAATSEVVQVAVEGVDQLETYFGAYLPQLFYAMLAPLTLFAALALIDVPAASVLLACVPLIPVAIAAVQTWAKRLLSKYWGQYAELGDTFLENLQGLTTLKIYQADEFKQREMSEQAEKFRRVTMRVLTMQLNSITVMDLVAYGGAAAGMGVALAQLGSGALGPGGCLAVILLAADYFIPMRQLGSFFHVAMNGMAASDKIFRLLDAEEPPVAGEKYPECGDVVARGLRFSYDGEREVLRGVDLDVPAGSFVAVVGESGCGKSTLASVLMGRARGYVGSVRVGGVEIAELDASGLLAHVTYVGHESYLFKGTVRENLLMAAPGAGDSALWDALERVRLAGFLRGEAGLDTVLAERASNLSGGQRQRLAMARALLHDTPTYLFDEATSNVGMESEDAIMDVVRALAAEAGRTVVLISHCLANVADADEVLVMDGGRVVERGRHEALAAEGGAYARLWRAQRELEGPTTAEGVPAAREASAAGGSVVTCAAAGADACAVATHAATAPARRGGAAVMARLVGLVRPLTGFMVLAVMMGLIGHLCAAAITVLAGYGLLGLLGDAAGLPLAGVAMAMAACAVARGLLRYGEQSCNHFIAFKLLALIRDRVFRALRRCAPAKLEGRDRGNLISVITSDIELLEVFYAHTISPAAIAVLFCAVACAFIGSLHPALGVLALVAYVVVGGLCPAVASRLAGDAGQRQRDGAGELSTFVLDSLRGLDEILQYGRGADRLAQMDARSARLAASEARLKRATGLATAITNATIVAFDLAMLLLAATLNQAGELAFSGVLLSVLALMSSFGPCVALASLGSTLQGTFAAGNRVLDVLDDEPVTEEVSGMPVATFAGASAEHVSFAYDGERVLDDVSLAAPEGAIVGVTGRSGSGKSTLLRLFMRFWDADEGRVSVSDRPVDQVNTSDLRTMEALVTQETHLFHDSIRNNLRIARLDASDLEIEAACRKASVHDFIAGLPAGYDTPVGELGDTLSGGERQRLGLARAFLHDAPFLLLDEPTSNLDALNEAVILRSIKAERAGRTALLVSHRPSTMRIADTVVSVENGRVS